MVVLYQVAYEHEARGVKSLKIQTFSRCKEGTIVYEPVKDLYRTGCEVHNRYCQLRNFRKYKGRPSSEQRW